MNPSNHSTTTRTTSTAKTASSNSRIGPGGAAVSQACAACKFQRRRCAPDCPLAPYFPAEKHQEFLNVHKLFGVNNLTKILKNVSPNQREAAMSSVIFQANARAADPVGGCLRILQELQKSINLCRTELNLVQRQVAAVRSQFSDGYQPMPFTRPVFFQAPKLDRGREEIEIMGRPFSDYINETKLIAVYEQDMKPKVVGGRERPDHDTPLSFGCRGSKKYSVNEMQIDENDSKKKRRLDPEEKSGQVDIKHCF